MQHRSYIYVCGLSISDLEKYCRPATLSSVNSVTNFLSSAFWNFQQTCENLSQKKIIKHGRVKVYFSFTQEDKKSTYFEHELTYRFITYLHVFWSQQYPLRYHQ